MRMYLHPGKEYFLRAVNSQIYVDKTEMIRYLNSVVDTSEQYVCVSRPRRFGKTMAADMICAYYDREADSRELFADRKLAGCSSLDNIDKDFPWDAYLGKFDVIRITMTDFMTDSDSVHEMLDYLAEEVVEEL